MRFLTDHKTNSFNNDLVSIEMEELGIDPSTGKAKIPLKYHLSVKGLGGEWQRVLSIRFQEGPIYQLDPEGRKIPLGPNGVSNEALLAIVLDRLREAQKGDLSCRENAISITHIEDALLRQWSRSRDRELRGVENTNKP